MRLPGTKSSTQYEMAVQVFYCIKICGIRGFRVGVEEENEIARVKYCYTIEDYANLVAK